MSLPPIELPLRSHRCACAAVPMRVPCASDAATSSYVALVAVNAQVRSDLGLEHARVFGEVGVKRARVDLERTRVAGRTALARCGREPDHHSLLSFRRQRERGAFVDAAHAAERVLPQRLMTDVDEALGRRTASHCDGAPQELAQIVSHDASDARWLDPPEGHLMMC